MASIFLLSLLLIAFLICGLQTSVVHPRSIVKNCVDSTEQCYDARLHPQNKHSTRKSPDKGREADSEFWLDAARKIVEKRSERKLNTNVAKNVIFFLGDGMSIPTTSAARMLLGGEEQELSFEKFPYVGLSKTYCLDRMVADSASTATAYLCGVKANYGTIGVDGHVSRKNCNTTSDTSKHVTSIAKWAQEAGKATGIVTNTRVTHASPAANYAHVADRGWESDGYLPSACPRGIDIATQLITGDVGQNFKVIFGGGRREFINSTEVDEEGESGYRTDGRNLIHEWLNADTRRKYVYNRQQLLDIDAESSEAVMGLFQNNHMLYHLEAELKQLHDEKPTLEEMTRKAIEIVRKNDKGYYLFVEGGKIDLAHHSVYSKIALDETVEFSKAIQAAVDMTDEEDTLIVVTADHAHTMSFSGYPQRGNEIFGAADISKQDNLPYMTLSYANGDGYSKYMDETTNKRLPVVSGDADDYKQKFPSTLPISSETHGGEDVGVYAKGPWSHLFSSTYEQNLIPHMMAYAACIGNGLKACDSN